MTDTFYFDCSAGTAGDVTQNVRTAGFGDGYLQAAKNGINARSSRWTVVLRNLSEDDCYWVAQFLDAHAGQSFYWTPPRSITQGRFMCSAYTLTPVEFGMQTITATFQEVFFP
jgi:phage-related protein